MIPDPSNANHTLLTIKTIRKNTEWYRITRPELPSPLYFNKDQSGRRNSPTGEYGVSYVANSVDTAFAETFGHNVMGSIKPGSLKLTSVASLSAQNLFSVKTLDTLYLGELNGQGLARLSLDNSINTTIDYNQVQQWSKWVYTHPKELHGLRYQSRHLSTELCCALFDNSQKHLITEDLGPLDRWEDEKSGRSIYDILDEQGWAILGNN